MPAELVNVAYNLGVEAFRNGQLCVPALDKELADKCLINCKVGEGLPYLKEWLNGWHDANLGKVK